MSDHETMKLSAVGVSRMFDNRQAVLVSFNRAPTDDELRDLHDSLRADVPAAGELQPGLAKARASAALAYLAAFDGKGALHWQDDRNAELGQALDWMQELCAMVLNLADRCESNHECDELRMEMSKILDRVAVALRGEPPSKVRWSWHDLPDRVAAAMASMAALLELIHTYNPDVVMNDDGTMSIDLPNGDELRIVAPADAQTSAAPEVEEVTPPFRSAFYRGTGEPMPIICDLPLDITAGPRAEEATCEWLPDPQFEGDTFDGTCGVKWSFIEGGPGENDCNFCPQCGGRIITAIAAAERAEQ